MELKAILEKPYEDYQRTDFIMEQQFICGYVIKETEEALEAWGYTDEEQLQGAKDKKYNEANNKAGTYLESGEALYEFEEGKHIEATDGNIAKMTAYALAYLTGQLKPEDTVVWNTKEDETVELTQEQIVEILNGLGVVQARVWSVQFPTYVAQIESATTIEEVEAIIINYAELTDQLKEQENETLEEAETQDEEITEQEEPQEGGENE